MIARCRPGRIHHDHVIEALASNRADDALHVGVLPRRARCSANRLSVHGRLFAATMGRGWYYTYTTGIVSLRVLAISYLFRGRRHVGIQDPARHRWRHDVKILVLANRGATTYAACGRSGGADRRLAEGRQCDRLMAVWTGAAWSILAERQMCSRAHAVRDVASKDPVQSRRVRHDHVIVE